jgi:hypothetical protein
MAARFKGITSRVTVADTTAIDFAAGPLTLEYWLKPDDFVGIDAPSEGIRIIGDEQFAGSDCFPVMPYWVADVDPAGRPELEVSAQPTGGGALEYHLFASTQAITAGSWAHIAIVLDRDAGEVRLYVDGAQAGGGGPIMNIASTTVANTCGVRLSSHHNPFTGYLDEVRMWSTVRTPDEIQSQRFDSLTGCEPGLVAYWPFETDTGEHGPARLPATSIGVALQAR